MSIAKRIFDLDRGWIEDRTSLPHRHPIDIDVRLPSAPAGRRMWIYWGSAKDLETAEREAEQAVRDGYQVRFVKAKTGEVINEYPD